MAVTAPALGSIFQVQIDASSAPSAALSALGAYQSGASGLFIGLGELLVDPASALLATSLLPSSGAKDVHALPIPGSLALHGFTFTAQGLVLESGGKGFLTNAIDAHVGN